MRTGLRVLVVVALAVAGTVGRAAAAPVSADRPAGWRGDGTGRFPDARPPLAWSEKSNVVWRAELKNRSCASPILVGDRLFVCEEPDTLVCVSAADGAVLWRQSVPVLDLLTDEERAEAKRMADEAAVLRPKLAAAERKLKDLGRQRKATPDDEAIKKTEADLKSEVTDLRNRLKPLGKYAPPPTHGGHGYSSSTPTSDGTHVYTLFGTGVAAAHTLDGRRAWARRVERPTAGWGHSSSPLRIGDVLVVHVRGLEALDAATGATRWRAPSSQRWGSPVAARLGVTNVIVTAAGELVRAADGQVLARKQGTLEYASPVVHGDTVYFLEHGGSAVRLAWGGDGALAAERLWTTAPPKERYYASGVWHDGLLYTINQKGLFSAIAGDTGKVVYTQNLKLKGTVFPSVCLADGRLYVSGDGGQTVVVEPGPVFKELARSSLERFASTPLFDGSRVYVRCERRLYCLAAAAPEPISGP